MYTFQTTSPTDPFLAQVLQFLLKNRTQHNIVVVRNQDTAELVATLLADMGPVIVHSRLLQPFQLQTLDTVLDALKNGTTNLVISYSRIIFQGWQPFKPELTTVSCTYELSKRDAAQLAGRLRTTDLTNSRSLLFVGDEDAL